MAVSSHSPPTTQELLLKRSEEEEDRFERLGNPTYAPTTESEKRGATILAAVFGE